jgi:hypothetical protein
LTDLGVNGLWNNNLINTFCEIKSSSPFRLEQNPFVGPDALAVCAAPRVIHTYIYIYVHIPLLSEIGVYARVKARFWPWLSVKIHTYIHVYIYI